MKKRMKAFFTLNRHSDGFTLVELIVVIAILAILAGVAVPAYSGYIKKANEATDNQLLAAVNTAFAAACIENGVSPAEVASASLELTGTEGNMKVVPSSLTPAELAESFASYYAGNENAAFKVFISLGYDNGNFVGNSVFVRIPYGGGYISLSPSDLAAMQNSGWFTYEGLGTDALLGKVNFASDMAAEMLLNGNAYMTDLVTSEQYTNSMMSIMGIDPSDPDAMDKYMAKGQAMINQKVELLKNDPAYAGKTADELAEIANNQIMANNAVLIAAQNASSMKPSDITTLLTATDAKNTIKNNLENDPNVGLSQAALAYGMYTAYAHSTGKQELIDKTNDPLSVMSSWGNDAEFKAYLESPQGQADLEGYLAGLNMVGESSKDGNAASNILINGFDDPALSELINGAITGGK